MNLEAEINRELWGAVRRSYESEAWSNAILDALQFLGDAVRQKSGLQSDGTALAGQAFGGKNPKLRLNRLQTESELNVQSGVEQLFRGLYQAVRNPRSHEKVEDGQNDADALILFIDYMLRTVGHARNAFSVDASVRKVLDKNFVASERYARLIIAEVPERKRLQVALEVYQRRAETQCEKLRHFFQALVDGLMSAEDSRELFQAISEELATTNEEASLRSTLQVLSPPHWAEISEVARLRSENWLIENVREGRYNSAMRKCLGGALATWSRQFWPHFVLRKEMSSALVSLLRSESAEQQDYVFRFFFASLDLLTDKPPYLLLSVLRDRLEQGDERFREAIANSYLWKDELWDENVKNALETFEPAERSNDPKFDDDIPF